MLLKRAFLILLGILASGPAMAASETPLARRAAELVPLFNGERQPQGLFSPAFLAQVPPAQVQAVSDQLRTQFGKAQKVERIDASTPASGIVMLDFEEGTVELRVSVQPQPPHLIEGLYVTGSEIRGDSLAKVVEEMKTLPGRTSFAAARLAEAPPSALAAHQPGEALAIGSAFKLFVLAELSRQIAAGERKWSDVVPLTRTSLPSGVLQDWPKEAPLTLHTLATLMISQSDNSAADTLIHLLGREKVEAMLTLLGVSTAERNRPFPTTLEAFALKAGSAELKKAWREGQEAQRRALLAEQVAKVGSADIDASKFAGTPAEIETVEWFASAQDMVRTMDWLRRNGGDDALQILAVNPGIGAAAKNQFGYLGFKGGSEAGVVNLTFLLRSKSGAWHAIAGTWNNPAAPLDENRFVLLMSRAVALLR